MPLLYKGALYQTPGVDTRPPAAGLTWRTGESGTRKRTVPITQMVHHWTAGSGDEKGCYRVLTGRGLSVQLFLRADGVVFQYVDLDVVCSHAGSPTNGRSIGIEQQNVGHGKPSAKWPRPRIPETVHGRTLPTSQFYEAQFVAAIALRKALAVIVPTLGPVHVDPRAETLPLKFRNTWVGDLAHYQISDQKRDPGTTFMARLARGA